MKKYFWYGSIFLLLWMGFGMLFYELYRLRWMERLLRRTKTEIAELSRRRLLENRRELLALQKKYTLWYRLEQELHYSGWKRRLPFLTAELWMMGNIVMVTCGYIFLWCCIKNPVWPIVVVGGMLLGELVFLWLCKLREMHAVNNNLIKFLNILGNYSITAGEITGIFKQVSRYVEEPLKSALSECYFEAQTTGDVGGALLTMGEKIEHPKFKELARNLEVSVRYCADFTLLVVNSRKSVREYLRLGEERRGMLYEAIINVLLLLIMSIFSLVTVDKLIVASVWDILRYSLPGRMALGIVTVTLLLLLGQFYRIYK